MKLGRKFLSKPIISIILFNKEINAHLLQSVFIFDDCSI